MLTESLEECPGAYLLEGEVGERPLRLTVLQGSEATLLLDTGCHADVEGLILPAFAEIGVAPDRLTHILITHCDLDHQGGNHAMKEWAPEAQIGCGKADEKAIASFENLHAERYDFYRVDHGIFYPEEVVEWIRGACGKPQPMDVTYNGGETVRLSKDWAVEVLHLPGHSRGHLGLWDAGRRILFGGDAIHGKVYKDLSGKDALCPTYLHVKEYLETITRIESLAPEVYVGCHWPILRGGEVGQFCEESRAFVKRAEALILEAIGSSMDGRTLKELCMELGPHLGNWPEPVNAELCYAIHGHLEDLLERGLIQRAGADTPARYLPN